MAAALEAVRGNLPTQSPWSVSSLPSLPLLRFSPTGENQRMSTFAGRTVVMVNNYRLAREVLDEKRFHKAVAGALKEIRILVGDGLFTAYDGEPNWATARQYSLVLSY
jgi:hypothetical protein